MPQVGEAFPDEFPRRGSQGIDRLGLECRADQSPEPRVLVAFVGEHQRPIPPQRPSRDFHQVEEGEAHTVQPAIAREPLYVRVSKHPQQPRDVVRYRRYPGQLGERSGRVGVVHEIDGLRRGANSLVHTRFSPCVTKRPN
jgi:hypothetical protein